MSQDNFSPLSPYSTDSNQSNNTQPSTSYSTISNHEHQTKTVVIQLKEQSFNNLLNETDATRTEYIKQFKSTALDANLKEELLIIEKKHLSSLRNIRIQHQSSKIFEKEKRKDSSFLTAYARCSFTKDCQVKYVFNIKTRPPSNQDYYKINVRITNQHNHDSDNPIQIRGKDRFKVGQEIMSKHHGNAYNARKYDIAETTAEETASNKVYRSCKSEYNNKECNSSNW